MKNMTKIVLKRGLTRQKFDGEWGREAVGMGNCRINI